MGAAVRRRDEHRKSPRHRKLTIIHLLQRFFTMTGSGQTHMTLFPQEVLLEQRITDFAAQVSMGLRVGENKNTTEWRAVMSRSETPFLRRFYIKTFILPRQARDKHKKKLKKNGVSHSRHAPSDETIKTITIDTVPLRESTREMQPWAVPMVKAYGRYV
eukprot:COSAG06_NODE_3925_length_4760_cov_17.392620_2_plen_159_part_00